MGTLKSKTDATNYVPVSPLYLLNLGMLIAKEETLEEQSLRTSETELNGR
jgi:hypothetical protein